MSKLAEDLDIAGEEWVGSTSLSSRKALGQFMTPEALRERLLDKVRLFPGMKVLDPGVGTGGFLGAINDREPSAILTGWDVDENILTYAEKNCPYATLKNKDALSAEPSEEFDLVIGNPPYFQIKATKEQKSRFSSVISGRPNIFAMFFQVAMENVRPGGQIAFVVPPSMNNGSYFNSLREFIEDNSIIDFLEIQKGDKLFDNAQTSVQLMVLTKGESGKAFHFDRVSTDGGFRRTIFNENPSDLEDMFKGRKTIFELGYESVTGTIVWNQVKDRLSFEDGDNMTRLLWAKNIGFGNLRLDNYGDRAKYVKDVTPMEGPAIIVNRIVGSVGEGVLRSALIPRGVKFVGENHTNVIIARKGVSPLVSWLELLEMLQNPTLAERVRLVTGNTQISTSELNHLLPLD